ncbi:DUF3307 domain-containing protein [Bailinhaonella thermotolerans]|uniref:DUF3307 domain-containing protein n=1 Tax=Bailinhaonella thermotolerans TaxID=1070861 RepID=A0A3A4ARM2_9ACTN|nr:DUF3307 domain-containing protein [Bailinhaonella thermotolerans]RJL23938.1 DUF3307 domain-containing protein [Bailinhaonella thermotolerans]
MVAESFLAHLVGDYVLQSEWMATQKFRRWWPAIVHGLMYSLPFLLITQSPWALLVIGGTHAVLDHYRVAKHVIRVKNNLLAPPSYRREQAGAPEPPPTPEWLVIVVDNTMHLVINYAALTWLG